MDTSQMLKGVIDVAVLAVVADEDGYGYDVVRRLRARGLVDVADASVYGTLRRLYAAGALTSYVVPSEEGPHRRYLRRQRARPRVARGVERPLAHIRAGDRRPAGPAHGGARMTTIALTPEGEAFLARVRNELADLRPTSATNCWRTSRATWQRWPGRARSPLPRGSGAPRSSRRSCATARASRLARPCALPRASTPAASGSSEQFGGADRHGRTSMPGSYGSSPAAGCLAVAVAVVVSRFNDTYAWGYAHAWLPHPGIRGDGAALILVAIVALSVLLGRRAAVGKTIGSTDSRASSRSWPSRRPPGTWTATARALLLVPPDAGRVRPQAGPRVQRQPGVEHLRLRPQRQSPQRRDAVRAGRPGPERGRQPDRPPPPLPGDQPRQPRVQLVPRALLEPGTTRVLHPTAGRRCTSPRC